MKRQIDHSDLPLLNLILDRDPGLSATVLGRLDTVSRALGPSTDSPTQGPGGPLETRIVDWLRSHSGSHAPGVVREGLGIKDGDKAFKEALGKVLGDGRVKADGQGRSRKYWIAS